MSKEYQHTGERCIDRVLLCEYVDRKLFHPGMILAIESVEFNTDTQMMEIKVRHCD